MHPKGIRALNLCVTSTAYEYTMKLLLFAAKLYTGWWIDRLCPHLSGVPLSYWMYASPLVGAVGVRARDRCNWCALEEAMPVRSLRPSRNPRSKR